MGRNPEQTAEVSRGPVSLGPTETERQCLKSPSLPASPSLCGSPGPKEFCISLIQDNTNPGAMISLLFQATLLESPKVQGLPNNWVGESALPGNCSTPRGGTEVHLLPRMNLQADVADRLRGVFGGRTVDKNPRSLCVDSVPGTAGL